MAAENRYEMASSVQHGLVLPRATRATSIFMRVSIRPWEVGASRLSRSLRILRHRHLGLPISLAGAARAGSDGCPEHRRQGASPGTPSRQCLPPSSPPLRRPCSRSSDCVPSLPTRAMANVSAFSRTVRTPARTGHRKSGGFVPCPRRPAPRSSRRVAGPGLQVRGASPA